MGKEKKVKIGKRSTAHVCFGKGILSEILG